MSGFFDTFLFLSVLLFMSLVGWKITHVAVTRRINPVRLKRPSQGLPAMLEALFVATVTVWIAAVIVYVFDSDASDRGWLFRPILPESLALKALGCAIVIPGFVLIAKAYSTFGRSWRLGIDETTPGDLVTQGIFSRSRNPIYLFFDLYFLGAFLMNGRFIFLVFSILIIVLLHFLILSEEKYLHRTYGEGYADYCSKTGRYITIRRPS